MPDNRPGLSQPRGTQQRRGGRRILLIMFAAALLLTISFFGWADLYRHYLEVFAPQMELLEVPRGIGLTPVSALFTVSDRQSGLAEVVIWVRQKDQRRQLLRRSFTRSRSETINVQFPGERSDLDEGVVELELQAKDSSLWGNKATRTLSLPVDFHKPKVELFADDCGIRSGGSQLAFYRAFDESLAVSGLKAGNLFFDGFPARALDKSFQERSLFVVLFAAPLDEQEFAPRIFAEDMVGNAISVPIPCRVAPRSARQIKLQLSDSFLRGQLAAVADQNMHKIQQIAAESGRTFQFTYRKGSEERLLEKFKIVNDLLREVNSSEVVSLLRGRDYERYWEENFRHPVGEVQAAFGDQVTYMYQDTEVAQARQYGYTIIPRREVRDVLAANNGLVAFSDNLGVYGRTVAIAHGLGVASLYGQLYSVNVKRGDMVSSGQTIGELGSTGLAQEPSVYIEVRVGGVPVDPREWWDPQWYGVNVNRRINDMKKLLGIQVYKTLE